jgi:uncharacterized protein YabN with tetrapyrrole methylase and pyrophosphatase domain
LEEVYETTDAIFKNDTNSLKEELGDVLLHIIFQAVIAEEQNLFTLKDVLDYSFSKMVDRHPHIFSNVKVESTEEVLQN